MRAPPPPNGANEVGDDANLLLQNELEAAKSSGADASDESERPPTPDTEGADPTGVWQGLWDAGRVVQAAPGQAMPGMAGGTDQAGVVKIVGEDPLQALVRNMGQPAVDSWRARYAESVQRMDLDIKAVWAAAEHAAGAYR